MKREDLLLYLVTDRDMADGKLEDVVEEAILGGVTMVQLREKHATFEEFCEKALIMKAICDKYCVPLIINDSVEVCLTVGASGVHLGQSDCDIKSARSILGKDKIIGASARDIESAVRAASAGADYLGVGAVFGTTTKGDAKTINTQVLKSIAEQVNIPVVAIGGISEQNAVKLKGTGIAGVAVVSGIIKSKKVTKTAQNFVKILTEFC